MKEVNFSAIEKKWQKKWEDGKVFVARGKGKKFYVLEMFPYPSGTGLHIGHALNYTIGDIYARFKRMQGFDVLYPMGYDSLGLPAENAAIKAGTHPRKYTEASIKNFIKQQRALGLSYDWDRMVVTSNSDFYKWDQWIFLKMFEKGVAFKKKAPVNWCRKCKTVLANEQVHNGKCWRHEDVEVEVKHLEQWFFKTTDYAEELNDFSKLDGWPDVIKKLQKNWIGKSFGTEIDFEINGNVWKIFTTRPDTIYGVTFMVVSAQHTRLMELVTDSEKGKVEKFLKKVKSVSEKNMEDLEKEGVFTGSYAVNPINGEKVPVYVGNFVLAEYGSGMVMAVPAHDQRDFEFAKKYGIEIKQVIAPKDNKEALKVCENLSKGKEAYTGPGELVHSDTENNSFTGLDNHDAKEEITKFLAKKKLGRKTVNFKLRDWLVSRQRYWGTPIPIIYCDDCGAVPVPEKELPVKLPENVKFGKGNPLESVESWIKVKCPKCGKMGRRETDTMDTFVNSSWYYLRYCDNKNDKKIFDSGKTDYWCPIDLYIGGKEHACMHLIYVRFYTKFLRDLGLLKIDEPAVRLFNQGYLFGEDGRKMSKSYGNVIEVFETIAKYGADALRFYLVSVSAPESDFNWNTKEMQGTYRFIKRLMGSFDDIKIGKSSKKVESKVNKAVKEISSDIENMKYNLAVIKLRQMFDGFEDEISKRDLESFVKLLSVFCPHIAEELWNKLGGKGFVALADWPKFDEKKIDVGLEAAEGAVDKLKNDIEHIKKLTGKSGKVYVYVLPKELGVYSGVSDVEVFAVNDKEKYDPEGKSKKVKPGRPGIYIE